MTDVDYKTKFQEVLEDNPGVELTFEEIAFLLCPDLEDTKENIELELRRSYARGSLVDSSAHLKIIKYHDGIVFCWTDYEQYARTPVQPTPKTPGYVPWYAGRGMGRSR